MATLYELTNQMAYLMSLMQDPDVDKQVIEDTMEGIDYELEEKADGYAKIMQQLNGEVELINKEIERLTERKKSLSNNAESLKKALEEAMRTTNKLKFKTALFSFSVAKNPPSVNIIGEVPESFLVEQEPKVDKKALLAFLKEHGNTEYAEIKQTESLRIK